MSSPSFEAFESHDVQVQSEVVGSLTIRVRKHGHGPPVLLLHGYPQTSQQVLLWNRVAPQLSATHTVIVPDLRGYGSSSKPPGSETHVEYSKREMAEDLVQVMYIPSTTASDYKLIDRKHFGHDTFPVVAHDRGARVAHRLALDNPGVVSKLMILDILPTLWMYEHTDQMFATGYWHWFFLIQPSPFTENVILADPDAYWRLHTSKASHQYSPWTEEDVKVYQRAYFKPEAVHAACEDYRAASTIDLEHDRESLAAGTKLTVPSVCVLWGRKGMIHKMGKERGPLAIWGEYAEPSVSIEGVDLDCGHYIPEEQPEELLKRIQRFLG